MEISFLEVLITVFALVLFAVPGFLLSKFKMLGKGATSVFTTFLLYVCQPMLTFMSFQNVKYEEGVLLNLLYTALIMAFIQLFVILIVAFALKKRSQDVKVRTVEFMSVFGNVGYMGLPFLQSLFGDKMPAVMIYGAVVIAVFNFFNWTIGVYLISGDKSYIKPKKAILNPPTVALIFSMPLFLILKKSVFDLTDVGTVGFLLDKLKNVFNVLAEMVTPISMTVLGIRLSEMDVKSVFLNKYAYLSGVIKLILCPLFSVGVALLLRLTGIDSYVLITIAFAMAMPSATSSLLFAEQFNGEPYTASAGVLLSTVLSVLTIPLMGLLIGLI